MRVTHPIEINSWLCNGGINPLVQSPAHLLEVCEGMDDPEAYKTACRYATLRLEPTGEAETPEAALARFFRQREIPAWMSRHEIRPGARTTAQLLARWGCIDCRARCEDLADLLRCVEMVGDYNTHDALRCVEAFRHFNRRKFCNEPNCNNGSDLFTYLFGWEGSHVIYVDFTMGWAEGQPRKVMTPDGLHWVEYGPEEFKTDCKALGEDCRCDESDLVAESPSALRWRLWWD